MSGRLILLTVGFVMLAEVLIYVPSIANYRQQWLKGKLADAQIASLSLEATQNLVLSRGLEAELLRTAGVLEVALRRNATRILMLSAKNVPMADAIYDLRHANPFTLIWDAFVTLAAPGDRVITVRGTPTEEAGELIEIILYEAPLKRDMLLYSRNILVLSIIISMMSALLVYFAFNRLFVTPMRTLTESMVSFRQQPEDGSRVLQPQSDIYEIRLAEQELSDLQAQVRSALHQKTRLAALGTAVSKINHDLRNILASAQLISDMLSSSDDPKVQRLAPKLVASIDRAIDLASRTLKYGKAEEPPPQKAAIDFLHLAADVRDHVELDEANQVLWQIDAPADLTLYGDPDQMFRVLMNLCRNAVQAVCRPGGSSANKESKVVLRARRVDSFANAVQVDVIDTGGGIPEPVKKNLFAPFASGSGSTGLGLSIAKELVEANGGQLTLVRSDANGTHFSFRLPGPPSER